MVKGLARLCAGHAMACRPRMLTWSPPVFPGGRLLPNDAGHSSGLPGALKGLFHHVSIKGRFLPARFAAFGVDARPRSSQRRVSAGSMTSSISRKLAMFSPLPWR